MSLNPMASYVVAIFLILELNLLQNPEGLLLEKIM
jgi:hypothetical protein